MPNIRHELLIGASTEKIYHALTSEEGLSAWWAPGSKAKAEINSIAYFPFGAGYFKEMKITALQPFGLVEWNCMTGTDEWIATSISFELLPADKITLSDEHPEIKDQLEQQRDDQMTLLIFRHDNWKEYTSMFAECNYTWALFLRSLKQFCETGKGCPWPNQHRLAS